MRIALTGVTGVLGRNLLFEFIKRHLDDLDSLEILLLGRDRAGEDIRQRAERALITDGFPYIGEARALAAGVREFWRINVRAVHMDLDRSDLGLARDGLRELQASPIDLFFHGAALTDLRRSAGVESALFRTNVAGTERLLQLVSDLQVGEFDYIGSAYCCGHADGSIPPDYVNGGEGFRNPYEETKLRAEIAVRRFARERGQQCRYFRPSIICGRLMELPLGSICKFDVFYSLAVFLYRLKLQVLRDPRGALEMPLHLDLRVNCSPGGSLNIVPVDYVAKAIYEVCLTGGRAGSYHVVNDRETPHRVLFPLILDALNVHGVHLTEGLPEDPNRQEALLYRTVGAVFGPYVEAGPMLFDTSSLAEALRSTGLRCPPVDARTFPMLMAYAREQAFGLTATPEAMLAG
jgi:nucleoside-diphosphate-sugar epimerase